MHTRCPECRQSLAVTAAQLRDNRGMVRCEQCACLFDALPFISEGEEQVGIGDLTLHEPLPWDMSKRPVSRYWAVGAIFGIVLLAGQFLYFEGPALLQKPTVRGWAETLCGRLSCRLPIYRNLDDFEVLHRSFEALPDGNYVFKIVFSNQAAFRQNYPNIRLTLLDFAGRPLALRMFLPSDYLADSSEEKWMATNKTAEISLKIAAPQTKIGGYDFELTY
jgi:predicted Zn finger-like uncharacterized protein